MANHVDADRLLKLQKALSVKFHAKDHHGDTVFVEIEGANAQQILEHLQAAIASAGSGTGLALKNGR